MLRVPIALLVLAVSTTIYSSAQSLDQSEWPDGFTRANPDWLSVYMEEDLCARSVSGYVLDEAWGDSEGKKILGIPDVVVELKRDAREERIRVWQTKTNTKGKFRMKRIPSGEYILKTSKDGFRKL